MGQGANNHASKNAHERSVATTLLLLVALRKAHPRPLSTYEMGLTVCDDHNRPLSILIKTLAKDKYIEKAASAGKRAGYWTIAQRGFASLERRQAAARQAEAWIDANPNYTPAERAVLKILRESPQPASRIVTESGLLHSPVRTALKRLTLRRHVVHPVPPESDYTLTQTGRATAEKLAAME